MSEKNEIRTGKDNCAADEVTLGEYLASIRNDRSLSLRDVEKQTNKQVSNAYLSQIENDKIQQPSPNILHALAELYGISFERLMEKVGYIKSTTSHQLSARHGRLATFAEHNLTPAEERELMQYLEFIRNRDSQQ